MNQVGKLVMWCIHSTFSVALVYLVSIYLDVGERGAYANVVLALLLALAFIFTRGPSVAYGYVHVCMATLFITSAALVMGTFVTVVVAQGNGVSYEWQFAREFFSGISAVLALLCAGFFAFVAANELRLKYSRVYLCFIVQGVALYCILRYGPFLAHKYLGL